MLVYTPPAIESQNDEEMARRSSPRKWIAFGAASRFRILRISDLEKRGAARTHSRPDRRQTYTEAELADGKRAAAGTAQTALADQVFRLGLPQFKNLQPVWYWLVLAAAIGLFFDVAIRRIAVQPADVAVLSNALWSRLRGRAATAAATPQFMDRLKSRKQQVGESLEQLRAARVRGPEAAREAPGVLGTGVATAEPPPKPTARPTQPLAPGSSDQPVDYASRLLKAKKKVWEERQQENDS